MECIKAGGQIKQLEKSLELLFNQFFTVLSFRELLPATDFDLL